MLVGLGHVHFREGERGTKEATLSFDEAMPLFEEHGIKQIAATFHLRHPSDLRIATPQSLLSKIDDYDGPVHICIMPEANIVLQKTLLGESARVSVDIDTWTEMQVRPDMFQRLLTGWIVSVHFTSKLGWGRWGDYGSSPERSYQQIADIYCEVMLQEMWKGWIGHPFQWCSGEGLGSSIKRVLRCAAETGHIVELSVGSVGRTAYLTIDDVWQEVPMFRPDIIAQMAPSSGEDERPIIGIGLDAHHEADLKYGIENARRIAEWLIAEGVHPKQLWGWA